MKKRVAVIILAIVVLLQYFCSFVFAQDNVITNNVDSNIISNDVTNSINNDLTPEEQQKLLEQKNAVSDKLNETNVKLEYVQGELSDTMIKVQEAEDKVLEYEKDIENMQTQMDALQQSINDSMARLALANLDYNQKKEILANRLVAMYEAGDTEYLDVLLKSKNIIDFVSRYYVIEEMAEYDNQLINEIKTEKENIETTQKQLEEEQAQIKEVKAKSEQTSVVLSNMKTLQSSYANKLSKGEKELQDKITAYKKEQAEIEAQIMNSTNIPVDIQYTGGEMLWPVAASGTVITSNFGIREHPIQGIVKQHTGLDIGGAPLGTPVVAALDGVVTYAGWLGGYGNCVMINHGDGVVTLYGHGNKILTTVGKEVKQGETIMEVGSTGNSTGPHLHFEVRINGEYTNPLNYVKVP
jgi:murein DD-endopeptidase MepM/ murein hydrolase activator NlpD